MSDYSGIDHHLRRGEFSLHGSLHAFSYYTIKGYAGGSHQQHSGSGSNTVCLPDNPQWGNYTHVNQQYTALMYGTEYEFGSNQQFFSTINNNQNSLQNYDVPCVQCLVTSRSMQLMIPARRECPAGWTMEYRGYLVAQRYDYVKSEYICLDEAPDAVGSPANDDGNLFFVVKAKCGSLPCLPYVNDWELTCVVCTK